MTKWEYKKTTGSFYAISEEKLNVWGQDGWELVAIDHFNQNHGYFKRPISNQVVEENIQDVTRQEVEEIADNKFLDLSSNEGWDEK